MLRRYRLPSGTVVAYDPCATGPCAVLGQIRSLHASTFDNSLQEQLRAERSAQEMTLETQDCVEGVRAFFEKREPNFSEH